MSISIHGGVRSAGGHPVCQQWLYVLQRMHRDIRDKATARLPTSCPTCLHCISMSVLGGTVVQKHVLVWFTHRPSATPPTLAGQYTLGSHPVRAAPRGLAARRQVGLARASGADRKAAGGWDLSSAGWPLAGCGHQHQNVPGVFGLQEWG